MAQGIPRRILVGIGRPHSPAAPGSRLPSGRAGAVDGNPAFKTTRALDLQGGARYGTARTLAQEQPVQVQ